MNGPAELQEASTGKSSDTPHITSLPVAWFSDRATVMTELILKSSTSISSATTRLRFSPKVWFNPSTSEQSSGVQYRVSRAQTFVVGTRFPPTATHSFKGCSAWMIAPSSPSHLAESVSGSQYMNSNVSHSVWACLVPAAHYAHLAVNSSTHQPTRKSASPSASAVFTRSSSHSIYHTLDSPSTLTLHYAVQRD